MYALRVKVLISAASVHCNLYVACLYIYVVCVSMCFVCACVHCVCMCCACVSVGVHVSGVSLAVTNYLVYLYFHRF